MVHQPSLAPFGVGATTMSTRSHVESTPQVAVWLGSGRSIERKTRCRWPGTECPTT